MRRKKEGGGAIMADTVDTAEVDAVDMARILKMVLNR